MKSQRRLKEQNAWIIRAVLALHALLFAAMVLAQSSVPDIAELSAVGGGKATLIPVSLALAMLALAKLVLLGMIPAGLRDRLIHWRFQHPLPGSRAFTKIGPADPRVDMVKLEVKYRPLPTDPAEQNRLFYGIYKTFSDTEGVVDAHKSYLAARDIGTINLILALLLPGFAFWATGDSNQTAAYAGMLFLAYMLVAAAAQVYSSRFVENVLAVATADHQ